MFFLFGSVFNVCLILQWVEIQYSYKSLTCLYISIYMWYMRTLKCSLRKNKWFQCAFAYCVYWVTWLQNDGFLFYNKSSTYVNHSLISHVVLNNSLDRSLFSWSFLILTLPHTQFNYAATHLLRSPGSSGGFLCLCPGGRACTRLLQSRLVRFIGL